MRISRMVLFVALFAIPAVAQEELYPPIKIYIDLSGSRIPKGLIMSRIQVDCGNCVETINRGSADFLLHVEQESFEGNWLWTIYSADGTEYKRAVLPRKPADATQTIALTFYKYSETLAEVLSKQASEPKPKASKAQGPRVTKKTTQRTI